MRASRGRSICIAVLSISLWSSTPVTASAPRYAPLEAMLDKEMSELAMPGVSAAMIDHGRLVWTGARGWADKDKGIKVTAGTPFNVASLTKPMTAVVLMQLVERGKLSLDTPMQRFDPSYKDPRVKVRHVLSMTAESDPPGAAYKYNGAVYGTLKSVVKGAAGEELAKAFSSRLFEPLRLRHISPGSLAAASDRQGLTAKEIAHYESVQDQLAKPYNVYALSELVEGIPPYPQPDAAANVVSTASDYARFADAVMRGRFLKPATLKKMWTPAVLANGKLSPYAYGWFSENYHGHRLIYHYGYYPSAYSAVMLIVPERQLVFVALSNGGALSGHNGIDGIEGNALACSVLIAFVDAKLPCRATVAASIARWRSQLPPKRQEMHPDVAILREYAGAYQRPNGDSPAHVFIKDGKLWWQTVAQPFELTEESGDRFFMKADDRTLVFTRDKSGRITGVDITFPGVSTIFSLPRL
jgi:CubicO group peptidase (beta-lactamase class C family)